MSRQHKSTSKSWSTRAKRNRSRLLHSLFGNRFDARRYHAGINYYVTSEETEIDLMVKVTERVKRFEK